MQTRAIRDKMNITARQIGIMAYSNKFTRKIYDISADLIGMAGKKFINDYSVNGTRREVERAWAAISPEKSPFKMEKADKQAAIEYLLQEQKPSFAGFKTYKMTPKPIFLEIEFVKDKRKAPVENERTSKKGTYIRKDPILNSIHGKKDEHFPIGANDTPMLKKPLKIKDPKSWF